MLLWRKKNQELREQVNALSEEIRKLKEHITEHTSSQDRSAQSAETALQFYSDAHDQSQAFQADISKDWNTLVLGTNQHQSGWNREGNW